MKILDHWIKILYPIGSNVTKADVVSAAMARFRLLCDSVRKDLNVAVDNESILLLLLAAYEKYYQEGKSKS